MYRESKENTNKWFYGYFVRRTRYACAQATGRDAKVARVVVVGVGEGKGWGEVSSCWEVQECSI